MPILNKVPISDPGGGRFDVIKESTPDAGVTVESVLIKDNAVTATTITGTNVVATTLTATNVVTSTPYVKLTDAATATILAANSGKVHIIPNLGQDCTISLPTAAAGLIYKFIYGGVAADTNGATISTKSNTNYYTGGITWLDSDATENEVVPVYPNGSSNSKLTIKPCDSMVIEVICDGTLWYISGIATATATPVFANQ